MEVYSDSATLDGLGNVVVISSLTGYNIISLTLCCELGLWCYEPIYGRFKFRFYY